MTRQYRPFRSQGSYISTESRQQIEQRIWRASGLVKTLCCMPNNVAYITLYNAYDYARRHPGFRMETKKLYRDAMESYKVYERRLYAATENRMFHLNDLTANCRKRYGDITDKEYFEFWQDIGSRGYTLALPHLQALTHKFRTQLKKRDTPHYEILAHQLLAQTMLTTAVAFHRSAITLAIDKDKVPSEIAGKLYGQFSLAAVEKKFSKALLSLCPNRVGLDEVEERNIEMTVKDITDIFANEENINKVLIDGVADNEDIFRTKGEMKKTLRQCAEQLD